MRYYSIHTNANYPHRGTNVFTTLAYFLQHTYILVCTWAHIHVYQRNVGTSCGYTRIHEFDWVYPESNMGQTLVIYIVIHVCHCICFFTYVSISNQSNLT